MHGVPLFVRSEMQIRNRLTVHFPGLEDKALSEAEGDRSVGSCGTSYRTGARTRGL